MKGGAGRGRVGGPGRGHGGCQWEMYAIRACAVKEGRDETRKMKMRPTFRPWSLSSRPWSSSGYESGGVSQHRSTAAHRLTLCPKGFPCPRYKPPSPYLMAAPL